MIHYALECEQGHAFDGWFGSSEAFDAQAAQGLLSCPMCNSVHVHKALMAPAVKTHAISPEQPEVIYGHADDTRYFAKIRKEIEEKAENVGERFPEVARQIHYKEIKAKSIYGQATLEEAYHLAEEGVEFMAIPPAPEGLH